MSSGELLTRSTVWISIVAYTIDCVVFATARSQADCDKIYVLISNGRRYRIVAAAIKVAENELEIFDSPSE
jgi:hypothetical protein